MRTVLIELDSVSKLIASKLVIDQISFKIYRGELTTLIGPNGAGKSTLARLVLGLDAPSAGCITRYATNLKIGYVPQKLETGKNLPITVKHFFNLLSPNLNSNFADDLLAFAEFHKLQNLDISKLSGGQLQRLILAATLLNDLDMLILDEPTKSLDVNSQQEFYTILEGIKVDKKLTILMISHDLYTVMKNSNQVICLNHHICCMGSPEDIKHNDQFLSSIGHFSHHHNHKH